MLLRERTDKKADATDAGLSQITSYLEDAAPETRTVTPAGRASEIVRRAEHASTVLAPGDRLEVVTFFGGG